MVLDADRTSWVRDSAVAVHDDDAGKFVAEYADRSSHYQSAFRYGRKLIDETWRKTALAALGRDEDEALDIGCGIGVHMRDLLAAGKQVHGVEPSAGMREQALGVLGTDLVSDGTVLALDFEANRFEFAYAIEVFRYLDSAANRLGHAEICRVLRPGGTYFGTYVNRFALDGFWTITKMRRFRHRLGAEAPRCHVEFETPTSIRRKLLEAGFTQVDVFGAMVAPLRLLYKLAPRSAANVAPRIMRHETTLSSGPIVRGMAGHLIVRATK